MKLDRTLGEQHGETLERYAGAIEEAKAAQAKELERRRKEERQQKEKAPFPMSAIGLGVQGGQVRPNPNKMEIESQSIRHEFSLSLHSSKLTQASIQDMARGILIDMIQQEMANEKDNPKEFRDQMEREFIQTYLASQFPSDGSWPESDRDLIGSQIRTDLSHAMEKYLVLLVSSKNPILHVPHITDTASNQGEWSSDPVVIPVGAPDVSVNFPEQSMEISQGQLRGMGQRPPLRKIPSTELNRDAVINEANKIVRKKRRSVPDNKKQAYDTEVEAYLASLQKALPYRTWAMINKDKVLKPIYVEILRIAKGHGYRDPKK